MHANGDEGTECISATKRQFHKKSPQDGCSKENYSKLLLGSRNGLKQQTES